MVVGLLVQEGDQRTVEALVTQGKTFSKRQNW